jgi:hypothetical protein
MFERNLEIFESGMVSTNNNYGKTAVLDCFVYKVNSCYNTLAGPRCCWKCSGAGCKITLISDELGNVIKEPRQHLHNPPDTLCIAAAKAVGQIKISAKVVLFKFAQITCFLRNQ